MLTDIEIAQKCEMKNIEDIAEEYGLKKEELELYGNYKAKINLDLLMKNSNNKKGKLILVTATSPTPAGEGKTTTTIGLAQALCKLGHNAWAAIREPSLGPVMGIKGGAAGGGMSQVVPMEDINLHFTGDMHAVTSANNLLCAMIDNHIHQGNVLNIDPRQIAIKRVLDTNDRALRNIVVGLGGKVNGIPREDHFMITVASEVMAILCLCDSLHDLKYRLGKMIVAYDYDNNPIINSQLKVEGAMTMLLKDAIKPNIVQTLEGTPALIHGGPFANIAHGCSSVIATKMALSLSDYTITEAGFGADLGAEKFFNIKCRSANLKPDGVVLVTSIRALKYNGGVNKNNLTTENTDALIKGLPNLIKHIENIKSFGVPVVVSLNLFSTDTKNETETLIKKLDELNIPIALSEVFSKGGAGGIDLASKLIEAIEYTDNTFKYSYDITNSIEDKIQTIVTKIYGGKSVIYSKKALSSIKKIEEQGYSKLPICMAKTQYSFSDDPSLLSRPSGFDINVQDISLSAGAGFIVVITGNVMTMPGLPKVPSAEKIDIDDNGHITGLF